jgi:hypothetical protein
LELVVTNLRTFGGVMFPYLFICVC